MQNPDDVIISEIERLKEIRPKLGWPEIGTRVGLNSEAARSRWRRHKRRKNKQKDEPTENRRGVKFREDQNFAQTESLSRRITTLEQLLEVAQVDLDVWRVDHYIINKWEVGAKAEYKDLTWNHGVIDGHLKAEGLTISPLFQVKAWLVRKELISLFPTIRPVECQVTFRRPPSLEGRGVFRSLIWADPQFGFSQTIPSRALIPFHDRQVLDVILQLVSAVAPDRVDCLGDFSDLVMWTDRFLRSPKYEYCTQPAICEGHWWLSHMRQAAPDAQMTVFEGNHDYRMRSAIMKHLRAAYGLRPADQMDEHPALSIPNLLALDSLGIDWIGGYPNGEIWLNDYVRLSHGDIARAGPGDTVKAVVMKTDHTNIFGHTHKQELASRTIHGRHDAVQITSISPGCACRIDGAVPGKTGRPQWQNGCAVVDYSIDCPNPVITLIPIHNGTAIWNGQVFMARDRTGDLKRDLPDWDWG